MNTDDLKHSSRVRLLTVGLTTWLTVALLTTTATAAAADIPVTLKETFKDHFLMGTAVNRNLVTGGAGFRRSAVQNAKDVVLVKKQFNQITAENDMKWALIHPREGKDGYDFDPADAFVNFGLSNNMYLVGHTLVWHSQTPNRVFAGTNPAPVVTNAAPLAAANTNAPGTDRSGRGRFGPGFGGGLGRYNGPRASRDELLQRMREHIHTVVGRYKGKVKAWDVVNEAIADGPARTCCEIRSGSKLSGRTLSPRRFNTHMRRIRTRSSATTITG